MKHKILSPIIRLIDTLIALLSGAPLKIQNYWPYSHQDFDNKVNPKGFTVGGFPWSIKIGTEIALLQKDDLVFVYRITRLIRLKGSDYLPGTEYEYDLKFAYTYNQNELK